MLLGLGICVTMNMNLEKGANPMELNYHNRADSAEIREKRRLWVEQEQVYLAYSAGQMGKWFIILFWLFISGAMGSFVAYGLAEWHPLLYIPGILLKIGCAVAYTMVLFKMADHEPQYRRAGVFYGISQGISIFTMLIATINNEEIIVLAAMAAVVLGILSAYFEYRAHADFFEEVDGEIYDSWSLWWKLQIAVFIAMGVSIALAVVSLQLVVIAFLLALLAAVVVTIMKQVLLLRSAKRAKIFGAGE